MNLDRYQAHISEGNLIERVRRSGPDLGEVQVADVPGQCESGTGEIRYEAVAKALVEPVAQAFREQPVESSFAAADRTLDVTVTTTARGERGNPSPVSCRITRAAGFTCRIW